MSNPTAMNRHPSTVAGTATIIKTMCSHCNSDDQWILHNVRLRGLYRRLCTSCVLKLHPSSFCPTCFALHDPVCHPTPALHGSTNNRTLVCFKCSSLSHATCVPPNAPKSPYLCPPCSNPNFKFFDVRNRRSAKALKEGENLKIDNPNSMDQKSAKALYAAAKIAASSMTKAAALAKGEAERRVRESALARKRAKEALEHVTMLAAREKERAKHREELEELKVDVSLQKRENAVGLVSGAVHNNGNSAGVRETGFKAPNAVVQVVKNGGMVVGQNLATKIENGKEGIKKIEAAQLAKTGLPVQKLANGILEKPQLLKNNHNGKDDKVLPK